MLSRKMITITRRKGFVVDDACFLVTKQSKRCFQPCAQLAPARKQPRRKSLCIDVVPGWAPVTGGRRQSGMAASARSNTTGCPHLAKLENMMAADQFSLQRRRSSANFALPKKSIDVNPQACPYHHLMDLAANATNKAIRIGQRLKEQIFPNQKTLSATKSYSEIPGPTGLPFFGSALEYTFLGRFSPKEFDKALKERHTRYGKIYRERIMNEEFVYISDPKDIRVLVQNEGKTPCRPHLDVIVRSREQEDLPVGITSMQGEEWLRNRNAINPVISPLRAVNEFRDAQKKVSDDFVSYMKKARSPVTGEIEDFEQTLNKWALESIAVVLLDSRLGLIKDPGEKFEPAAENLRKCMQTFFDYGARLAFSMPVWKLWNTRDWKIFRRCQREEFDNAGYFVDRKLQELAEGDADSAAKTAKKSSCLLEHVIRNKSLSRRDAVTVCLELLAGGIDTTASATIFTMYHLANNQKHQERLRELAQEENGETDLKSSQFSKYLKACVWESMRLNPLTYANMRMTSKKLVFSGFEVPAGTTVRYTSHLMNLKDEKYFPKPDEFLPERWMDKKSPYKCTEQFTFTPFGHGARQCPGRRVAEQEMDLLFRAVLENFRIEYHHQKMGVKVRLFNSADQPAKFSFVPLQK